MLSYKSPNPIIRLCFGYHDYCVIKSNYCMYLIGTCTHCFTADWLNFVMVNFQTRAKHFVFINKFSAMFHSTKLVFGVEMLYVRMYIMHITKMHSRLSFSLFFQTVIICALFYVSLSQVRSI